MLLHLPVPLQSAVGRMAGNPGASADAADMQGALQDVLMAQTAHVQVSYRLSWSVRSPGSQVGGGDRMLRALQVYWQYRELAQYRGKGGVDLAQC